MTVLIVGGTSGIGREVALRLAKEHVVIVAGRDRRAGEVLQAEMGEGHVFVPADVSTLSGVGHLERAVKARTSALDTLLNNAGIMAPTRAVTEEGMELNLAVHHLAPWSTTSIFLPLLARGAGRVVNTNSEGHRAALFSTGPVDIDFSDLQSERHYDMFVTYSQTKLANLLFTYELQRRVPALSVVAVHPGAVRSRLTRSFRSPGHRTLAVASRTLLPPAGHGADPLVYLATAESIQGGAYYDRFQPVASSPQSRDVESAVRLWEETEKLRGPLERYSLKLGPVRMSSA